MSEAMTIGAFHLGDVIGRGASAEVLEARAADGSLMAVKRALPPRPGSIDAVAAKRFEREIRLGHLLRHDGLASILAHGTDWIAFERLGPSLATPGRRQDFADPAAALRLLARLAETLAYIHGRGVVHRDLKPAQVLFRASDEPVLIDFGVAGLMGEDPLEGREIVGSPAWMAPEQTLGSRPAPAADIWSLCAVGHYLLTGRALFAGTADEVLALRQAGGKPALAFGALPSSAEPLRSFVEAGLAPDPGARPALRDLLLLAQPQA